MFYDENRIDTSKYKKVSQKKKNKIWNSSTCDGCGKEKEGLVSHRAINVDGKMISIIPQGKRLCLTCTDTREGMVREFLKQQRQNGTA